MRQIVETLTCDVCGKKNVSSYVHVGMDFRIQRANVMLGSHREDEIYEVRPTLHMCGKCVNAINSAAKTVVKDTKR